MEITYKRILEDQSRELMEILQYLGITVQREEIEKFLKQIDKLIMKYQVTQAK